MQVRHIGIIDAIKQMGPIRFRQVMINHPTITAMFDPEGESISTEEAWENCTDHPSYSWDMERQNYLHEVIDRNLTALFAAGFHSLDEVVASFQKSMDEVISYAAANSPRDYLGEENLAFQDRCTYQLMVIMSATKNLREGDEAVAALAGEKENWALIVPDSFDFLTAQRRHMAGAKKHLVKRLINVIAVATGRIESR
ncbi:hypothetical protein OIU34_20380 [Pararhizobium sp. BT-229]|uniref:hypothetical protein n=1 Tax=Pararhizobium sp. BT-229 TaxID=2986923 RepID=UPI0021F6E1D6|nr:hypothetical protein [Pararhizobium sp. BT-229]MCV9964246.1 hypothetical protein [Pararhizobium sp. BT-229]